MRDQLLEACRSFNRALAVRARIYGLALDDRRDAEALAPAAIWPGAQPGCGGFWMQRVA